MYSSGVSPQVCQSASASTTTPGSATLRIRITLGCQQDGWIACTMLTVVRSGGLVSVVKLHSGPRHLQHYTFSNLYNHTTRIYMQDTTIQPERTSARYDLRSRCPAPPLPRNQQHRRGWKLRATSRPSDVLVGTMFVGAIGDGLNNAWGILHSYLWA